MAAATKKPTLKKADIKHGLVLQCVNDGKPTANGNKKPTVYIHILDMGLATMYNRKKLPCQVSFRTFRYDAISIAKSVYSGSLLVVK